MNVCNLFKVNKNGMISLESSFSNTYPEAFPISGYNPGIALLWLYFGVIMTFTRVDQQNLQVTK